MVLFAGKLDVLCHFTGENGLRPFRFQYEDIETSQKQVITINRIIQEDLQNHNGNPIRKYRCESFGNNSKIAYELHYEVHTCKWRLYI